MKSDDSKSTILVIVVGFLALHVIFSWSWAVIVSLVVGIIGILSEYASRIIEYIWMKIARILQYIIPNILLTLIYFFMLFPLSILAKMFTKDILMLSKKYDSYFVNINKKADKQRFEKPW